MERSVNPLVIAVRPARFWIAMVATFVICGSLPADEVGFAEQFALAKDRSIPLKQLIPGTEEYYYYHCLYYQNLEQFDRVDDLVKQWIDRHKVTGGVREILHRQALLTYSRSPDKSLEYLRNELNLKFDHRREALGTNRALPTSLDPQLLDRERLAAQSFARHNNLNGFEDSALEWLLESARLDGDRRRELLGRLARPDVAGLPAHVVEDLKHRNSGGFGSLAIHGLMLQSQLEECARQMPQLLDQQNFVNTYALRLAPGNDTDWQHDDAAHEAYLDRLWAFASRLSPSQNSLKAHVLYHRLVFDRRRGIHDKQRFMTYIALPRAASYMNPVYLRQESVGRYSADMNADFAAVTRLAPVGDDEPLVRSYLQHFFVEETTYDAYAAYLDDAYLKRQFAETKITNGLGDAERWAALLTPAQYQALKTRIDLDFADQNRTHFGAHDPVRLELFVKNVPTLIVKVFRINAMNYYRENGTPVNTDVNLDGLVANTERSHDYREPSEQRVLRRFEFPELKEPGVYVVDFIGNGKSTRAVVRKGTLRYAVEPSVAGHLFRVYDESNQRVPGARIWLAGRDYLPDDEGRILVPYTSQPGRQPIVLTHGDLSVLDHFQHQAEQYSLQAGIFIDRESLIRRNAAPLLVRSSLRVNGRPATLAILEDVELVIMSTDLDGVATTKEVPGFELSDSSESVYELQVPPRLAALRVELRARVKNVSRNETVDLSAVETFELNGIDKTDRIEDLHFYASGGEYFVDVLGKTGEAIANRPVSISVKHRDFRDALSVALQSDAQGHIRLGPLADVQWVQASGHQWPITPDAHTYARVVHARAGQAVAIPYMGPGDRAARDDLSLVELRGGAFAADRFDAIRIQDGLIRLEGLEAGDFDLLFKRSGVRILVRLAEGDVRDGYVFGPSRRLEVRNASPLQIAGIESDDDHLRIRLVNGSEHARVHVFATRYQESYSHFAAFSRVRDDEPFRLESPTTSTLYAAGRQIGDEYRYILDRKYAEKFPGNMLAHPSLLLNPWPIRSTETRRQDALSGEALGAQPDPSAAAPARRPAGTAALDAADASSNLDFLAAPASVLSNLVADDAGIVTVARDLLGAHQQLYVVAIDRDDTVMRTLSLAPSSESARVDLRLADGLDPKSHYTQQKRVSVLAPGENMVIADASSSNFELYDSLARVYGLYVTLTGDPHLVEFEFITRWPELSDDEKRAKYSKYACHELNFFLARKDPQFFRQVVLPFLSNKQQMMFLDEWLLEADVAGYLQPWRHRQLNAAESILLAQRAEHGTTFTADLIDDAFELIPPDAERAEHLFATAMKSRALDTDDALGIRFELLEDERAKAPRLSGAVPAAPKPESETRARGRVVLDAGAREADQAELKLGKALPSIVDRAFAGEQLRRASDNKKSELAAALALRELGLQQRLYEVLDKTQEWVENHYYRQPIEEQNAQLVTTNAFWRDYAHHDPGRPFRSIHFPEASRNFPEMMLALAVLDLPFQAEKHATKLDQGRLELEAASPLFVFHQEIGPAEPADAQTPILVSQNFFRYDDRYRMVDGQREDKYVAGEFLVHTVYGCQIVVTNPTSARQKLDVLIQLPVGAMPVLNGDYTKSVHLDLEPFHTRTVEYGFYFPATGEFEHYPVHVARGGRMLASAPAVTLDVVSEPTRIDRHSWAYVSQFGSPEEVLTFLRTQNLLGIDLEKIAFRMSDGDNFQQVTRLLAERHVYHHTLWSYSVKHNDPESMREYLQHADDFVAQCGTYLDSPLLVIDPVLRKTYEHMDYRPLVNARAHHLGQNPTILNDRLFAQYERLLKILCYHRELDDRHRLELTHYMLLQGRIGEAFELFQSVDAEKLNTAMQYDYLTAYMDFFRDQPTVAREIAEKYSDHPVEQWRNAFASVAAQLDEVDGQFVKIVDATDRDQVQAGLASAEPAFDFRVESRKVHLDFQNLKEVQVNYYLMDVELLFSRNPFVQQVSGQFAFIEPNLTQAVTLPADETHVEFDLPEQLHNRNVLVEITAAGTARAQAYYSNSLSLQVIENYGQLRVTHLNSREPLAKTYVKVYAQMRDGETRFYKDGYTDLRGRFDYSSLSTSDLDQVQKFSILVLSDEHGAVIREAQPPKQ